MKRSPKRPSRPKKKTIALALRKPPKIRRKPKKAPKPRRAATSRLPARVTKAAARPSIVKLPDGADPKRHLVVDRLLRELVTRMTQMQFEFTALAQETLTDRLYVRHHYQDPDEYFEQRIGFSWRSLRRRLAIEEAFHRLEGAERADCRTALSGLGVHRAAILAPAIGKPKQDWREWVKIAQKLDEDALQTRVSEALGAKTRGKPAKKGQSSGSDGNVAHDGAADLPPIGKRWLDYTLSVLPEDARPEVEDVFGAGLYVTGHPVKIPELQVLLALVRNAKVEWEHEALAAGWTPKHGEHTAPAPADGQIIDAEAVETPA